MLFRSPISGPIGHPALGGSGLGDALIAFSQGPSDRQQVMGAVAKSPPGQFLAYAPVGWVKGGSATVRWDPAPEAFGTTTYAVLVDGRIRAGRLAGLSTRLRPRGLGDGIHHLQVLATDSLGQQTMTAQADLKVDASPPQVSVRHSGGRGVKVRVFDVASGALAKDTSISFGDGGREGHRLIARHTYSRSGGYVITVRSRDRVGHSLNAHLRVQIR